jgi:hypothetical protein
MDIPEERQLAKLWMLELSRFFHEEDYRFTAESITCHGTRL